MPVTRQHFRPGPAAALARAHKLHEEARLCDWPALAAQTACIAELGISGEPVSPFALLSLEDDPERQLRRACNFVQSRYAAEQVPLPSRPATMPSQLKIGYFSADFSRPCHHASAGGLLGAHDRAGFAASMRFSWAAARRCGAGPACEEASRSFMMSRPWAMRQSPR